MRRYLISYATENMLGAQADLGRSARAHGVDVVISAGPGWIEDSFARQHACVLAEASGAGHYLWKPYITKRALDLVREGDLVMYADAGNRVIGGLSPLFDLCVAEGGIMLFHVPGHTRDGKHQHVNRVWTKRDCHILLGCDEERYYDARQFCGSPQIYQKNQRTMRFVGQLLDWATRDPRVMTKAHSELAAEHPEFRDHRLDQSVLSLLATSWGIRPHRDPSQFGVYKQYKEVHTDYPHSRYGTLLNLHRRRY